MPLSMPQPAIPSAKDLTRSASNAKEPLAGPHPNALERKRIERALAGRKRYRYVAPMVLAVEDGYLVRSPCCSRRIDPEGGVIDIALFCFQGAAGLWNLYRKDQAGSGWEPAGSYGNLADLLRHLVTDPSREFWR